MLHYLVYETMGARKRSKELWVDGLIIQEVNILFLEAGRGATISEYLKICYKVGDGGLHKGEYIMQ